MTKNTPSPIPAYDHHARIEDIPDIMNDPAFDLYNDDEEPDSPDDFDDQTYMEFHSGA